MQLRTEIVKGKRRIIITRTTSGVKNNDAIKNAILAVMGPGYRFNEEKVQKLEKEEALI